MNETTGKNELRPMPWGWVILIAMVAVVLRLAGHFRTALVPGMDAGYYLVQSRSLLEDGVLQNPDLPLVFWVQASLAWTLQRLGEFAADDAIVLAVKLSDSLLPALAALPMGWLGWQWLRSKNEPPATTRWAAFSYMLPALVPAAIVSLSWPMMRMLGDFQKNALGLLWFALLIASSHAFLQKPSLKSAALPMLVLALTGMTHIGVLAASIVFMLMLLISASFVVDRKLLFRIGILSCLALVLLGGAIVAVTYVTQTSKFNRLINVVTGLFSSNYFIAGNDGPAFSLLNSIPWIVLGAVVAAQVRRRRLQLPASDLVLVGACVLTSIALAIFDQRGRLILIAVLPTAATISFWLANAETKWSSWIGAGLLGLASVTGFTALGARPVINESQYMELEQLNALVHPHERSPNQSIVFTQHGMEFWTNWILHVNAKQPALLQPEYWKTYENVFYLVVKEDDRMREPWNRPGPPNEGPGPSDRRGRGPRGPGDEQDDPRRNVKIPSDAEILHDGKHFVLAKVAAP